MGYHINMTTKEITTMTTEKMNAAGVRLMALIQKHGSARAALVEFMGQEAADKFLSDLYDSLRAAR